MSKKKMSKAEQEALHVQQEEEERLALEAEVKKLEDLRLQKEEEVRQTMAAQIEFRSQEIEQLKKEASEGKLQEMQVDKILAEEDAKEAADRDWKKHVECSSLPDASSEADVNTYISINEEESPATDIAQVLDECAITESVASEVRKVMANYESVGDSEGRSRCYDMLMRLRKTSTTKLDKATLNLIQRADEFATEDGSQVLMTHERAGIKVGIWANLLTKSFRGPSKFITFKDISLQVDIPRQLNQMKVAVRISHFPYGAADDMYENRNTNDFVVGGLINVDILLLPPPPKQVKQQWVIRSSTVQSSQLQLLHYGEEHGAGAILAPLKIHLHIPKSVFLVSSEALKVVLWDSKNKKWTTEGVHQDTLDYHPDTRALRFLTQKSGLFALVCSRVMNLPYKNWSLSPAIPVLLNNENFDVDQEEECCVHYTLNTSFVDVKIQIIGTKCQLLEPEIEGLFLKELPPGELLFALRDAGINLLPLDHDAPNAVRVDEDAEENAVGIEIKTSELESKVYKEFASAAMAFDIAHSRWNAKVSSQRSVFQVRETSVYTGGNLETFDYGMGLIEEDEESQSFRQAPDVGPIEAPAIKCSLIQQKEEKVIPEIETKVVEEVEVKKEEDGEAVSGDDAKEEGEEKGEAGEDKEEVEKKVPPEEFNEDRVAGASTHIYLVNALKASSSEEAMERVARAPPQLSRTLERILKLTRPISFS